MRVLAKKKTQKNTKSLIHTKPAKPHATKQRSITTKNRLILPSIPTNTTAVTTTPLKKKQRQQQQQHRHSTFNAHHNDANELDPNQAYSMAGISSESGMRRWYREIDIHEEADGTFALFLNGRYARTNRNNRLIVPTKAYAIAMALEHENQTTYIISHTMPLTEMAKIAIDRTPEEKEALIDNIMNIFNCDSATHRCDPEDYPALAKAQAKVFDPMIQWTKDEFKIDITATSDFWGADQSLETNQIIWEHVNSLNPYQFICLDNITALGKSTIVGLNFLHNNINIEQTVRASLMEEYYQMKVSGHEIGDTYGTWILDAGARQRVATHRMAMLMLGYTMKSSSDYKMEHPSQLM